MIITRRNALKFGFGFSAAALFPMDALRAQAVPSSGGSLVVALSAEPKFLNSAVQSNNAASFITPKLFDGLLAYDPDFTPRGQLAESWQQSDDGLTLTFRLRANLRWHDGQPLTAEDIVFSYTEAWKKFSPRASSLFATVSNVEAADERTIVWTLNAPSPYLIYAFSSHILQVIPKHVYAGTDLLSNPANAAPVGSGPFKFAEWERGSYLRLVRNEDYWDNPRPYLDEIIFRFIPDGASRAVALETGEVDLIGETAVPGSDLSRLSALPHIATTADGYDYVATATYFMFNLDRPVFQDLRVRKALAHAIDRNFIVTNIWQGQGTAGTGPVPASLKAFYDADTPQYTFDLEKAAALLDEAGHKPGSDGIRFSITHDPFPASESYIRVGEYLRDTFGRIGVKLTLRSQDVGAYVKRIYTDRDFDTANFLMSVGPDPAIGIQRMYWSKTYQPGTPFSNGSHYSDPQTDRLLEEAAREVDPARRRSLYVEFQRKIKTDIPQLALVDVKLLTLSNRRVQNHTYLCEGIKGNFAQTWVSDGK